MSDAAEKRKQLREARRAKILASGESRLGRITNTYSTMSKDTLEDVNVTHAPDQEINVIQPSETTFRSPSGREPIQQENPNSRTSNSDACCTPPSKEPARIPYDEKLFAELPLVDVDSDPTLNVPTDGSSLDNLSPPSWTIWDLAHFIFVFTLASICLLQYAFVEFLTSDSSASFGLSKFPAREVCRQVASMATVPISLTGDVPSSGIFFGHQSISVWVLFLTLEVALVSARMVFDKNSYQDGVPPIVITSLSSMGGTSLANVSSALSTMFMIWKSVTKDVLLFVFFLGAAISGSWVAENFLGIC